MIASIREEEMKYPDDFINKIICGDCLEVMKEMSDKCVDLVLTDPPHGKDKKFRGDDFSDWDLYQYLFPVFRQLERITKYHILVDTPKDKVPLFIKLMRTFNYEYPIILHETNSMRNGKVGFSNYGLIIWYCNKKKSINRYKDVISAPIENTKTHFKHPSPKNIYHYSRLIRMFSNKRDIILDPFLGSGTTTEACKRLGRNFIGIEINPDYCKIAEERLAQGVL